MIKFIIPGFYEHYNINKKLLQLNKQYPEWFYDNITINAIYGTFPFWVWDGGRIFLNNMHATQQKIQTILNTFNTLSLHLVCSNPIVEEKNLYNHFCNFCLQLCHNNKNNIIINSTLLENYIRINYPKYNFISSTTKCLNIEQTKKELINDNYKLVCLDYNLNNQWDIINSFTNKEINKIELLVNPVCIPNCPSRKAHYQENGKYNLTIGNISKLPYCNFKKYNNVDSITRNFPTFITPELIFNEYEPRGFEYYKLEGRTLSDIENVINYAYYMIKPQYKDNFILMMLYKDHINEMFEQQIK